MAFSLPTYVFTVLRRVFNISLDRLLEKICSLKHVQPKDHHKCVSQRHNHAMCVYILPYNINQWVSARKPWCSQHKNDYIKLNAQITDQTIVNMTLLLSLFYQQKHKSKLKFQTWKQKVLQHQQLLLLVVVKQWLWRYLTCSLDRQ